MTNTEWSAICAASQGTWLMPRSAWPAVPKTSIRGMRFFAHHPGYPGVLPKPESYAHTRLKIDVARVARALGYKTQLEASGIDSAGSEWVADVLITLETGRQLAFEIQLSSQHFRDFNERTERYARSNLQCCWIISNDPVSSRLAKSVAYNNMEYYREHGIFQADTEQLIILNVDLPDKNSYPENTPMVRFSRGPHLRNMQLEEAIGGVLKGYHYWERPFWRWQARNS